MTGTSFTDRSLRWLGGQSGSPLFWTATGYGIRISSRFFVYTRGPLLKPSTSGRGSLSRTKWRRRRAGPQSLLVSYWRPEPFTGCIRAPAWLRRLWTAAGDFQDHWRVVHTWNAGSCSGFWRVCPYVYRDVRQCSEWRGLSGVCTLSHSGQ